MGMITLPTLSWYCKLHLYCGTDKCFPNKVWGFQKCVYCRLCDNTIRCNVKCEYGSSFSRLSGTECLLYLSCAMCFPHSMQQTSARFDPPDNRNRPPPLLVHSIFVVSDIPDARPSVNTVFSLSVPEQKWDFNSIFVVFDILTLPPKTDRSWSLFYFRTWSSNPSVTVVSLPINVSLHCALWRSVNLSLRLLLPSEMWGKCRFDQSPKCSGSLSSGRNRVITL